jgi:2-dehydro-3-deoxyphosphogluconate aldolase/(4S)-4-hydroxy-2-oxoglutarate aldolase
MQKRKGRTSMDVVETLKSAGIIPVIVIEDEAKAVPLANALVNGGLPVLEVTFRTKAAAGAIAKIKAEVPNAVVGAGTLLTKEQVKAAKEAGAVFGVAPGFDPAIVAYAQEIGLPMVPGVATASELSQALTAGVPMVKFFPAEAAGGVKMIKNLLGAFRFTGVTFMPTGGVIIAIWQARTETTPIQRRWQPKASSVSNRKGIVRMTMLAGSIRQPRTNQSRYITIIRPTLLMPLLTRASAMVVAMPR